MEAKTRKSRLTGRLRADTGHHRRIMLIMCLLAVAAFFPIGLRLYQLMVVDYELYAQKALRNQSRSTAIAAQRGAIYDRNMNVLATCQSVENVYLNPRELTQAKEDVGKIAAELAAMLDRDAQWILEQAQDTKQRYKQIGFGVDEQTAARLRGYINENDIRGIHLEPGVRRVYPYGSLAAQTIGFTNASNQGSEGLEASYNRFLEGSAGKVVASKGNNEMDMPFSYEQYVASRRGCDLILTLDTTVQACLEKQIEAAIARYDVLHGAFGLVMNAKTGEILAMATLGGYDPNQYLEIADPEVATSLEQQKLQYLLLPQQSEAFEGAKAEYEKALRQAQLKQWRNRVLSDGYEPGSTFKVLTMAAALDCGAIDLSTNFYCTGAEQIPGRAQLLHCWRTQGHGAQKTPQALQNSCNIAFAHIALKLGGEKFYEYIEKFGILEKSGIDLSGESKGVFFDKEILVNTEKWGTASLTSASFGQTFKITPLQLVRAIASVVNGGYLLEPYLVSEVVDASGQTVLKQEPTVIRKTISEETSRMMRTLIVSVVEEGTAKNAQVAGFSIGGKTGTSEKIDVFDENGQRVLDKIVSFVGIAPMDDPEYIVLVALDTPSRETGIYISGGVMAAPTVGAVFSDILPYLGVTPTYDASDQAGRQVVLEDLTGLTEPEAAQILKEQKLEYCVIGEGSTVTGQIPAAGKGVSGTTQVLLYFGEPAPQRSVTVPDFSGMNRAEAAAAAGELGLSILVVGNGEVNANVVVTLQNIPAGTQAAVGTTIQLEFTDTGARD